MKLNEIKDEHLKMDVRLFVKEMQDWLRGKEVDEDTVTYMHMRLSILADQMRGKL